MSINETEYVWNINNVGSATREEHFSKNMKMLSL